MALYFTLLLPDGEKEEVIFHTGTPLDASFKDRAIHCIEVQADGNELQRIENNFRNIPTVDHQKVVRWTGEFARFIAMNF